MNFSRTESYSSLYTFFLCPAKYKNRYILKLKEEQTPEAERGSKFHSEIEKILFCDDINKFSPQAQYAEKFIYEHKKKKYFNLNSKNEKLIQYFEYHIGAKIKDDFSYEICSYNSPECIFRGKIDYLAVFYEKNENLVIKKIEVVDWKSGTSSGDKKQLKFYGLLIKNHFNVDYDKISLRFVYIDKKKSSDFLLYEEDENEILEWVEETKEKIYNENEFAPCKNWACKWCSFKNCSYHPENIRLNDKGLTFFLNLGKKNE